MSDLSIASMLVSKICHDLANTLSSAVFIKEDVIDGSISKEDGLNELLENIENLGVLLSFFRNIAVQSSHIGNLYDILKKFCLKTNIKLWFEDKHLLEHPFYEENIVGGILYILITASIKLRLNTEIKVTFCADSKITIEVPGMTIEDIPKEIMDIISMENPKPTMINIFGLYIKDIMNEFRYAAYVKTPRPASILVVICKL